MTEQEIKDGWERWLLSFSKLFELPNDDKLSKYFMTYSQMCGNVADIGAHRVEESQD